jgi:hypothetical protein
MQNKMTEVQVEQQQEEEEEHQQRISRSLTKNNNNVIVMSEAGKPIFARHESEEEIARQCGLIQALRTAVNGNSSLGLGELQSLQADDLCIVFTSIGSITLVSITTIEDDDIVETEAFARLQLEYIYAQLIFTLTDQVQNIFQHNPGFDLRSIMNSSDNLIHGILDGSSPESGNVGPFMLSAVQTIFPISFRNRHKASKVLQSIAGRMENNIAFALFVVGDKLLTVVQPSFRPHQLRVSDLHLILNFIGKQPGLASSTLWVPMCLPRFNSSGFLYAYTECFHVPSKLTLILLSSHGTTEQFQVLRAASHRIREELQLPSSSDTVLTIVEDSTASASASSTNTTGSDVGWRRTDESTSFDSTSDEDYVNISAEMIGTAGVVEECDLLKQVRLALQISTLDNICKQYLDDEEILFHFLFRLDVPVKNSTRHQHSMNDGSGHLSQCISPPPVSYHFESDESKRKLWKNYQTLSLRLRLGSATVESTMDAFDMINDSCCDDEESHSHGSFPGIGKNCPAICLVESPAYTTDGLSYIIENDQIFLGMNGKDFEL